MYARQHSGLRRVATVMVVAAVAVIGQLTSTITASATGTPGQCAAAVRGASRVGSFGGIERPTYRARCGRTAHVAAAGLEPPYEKGSRPPLKFGGPGTKVMATDPSTPLTITPIFWGGNSPRYGFSTSYVNLILQYLTDVTHDSGATSNVYAALTQYYMTAKTGPHVRYDFAGRWTTVGHPLIVPDKIPATCATNTGRIYHNDPIGYTTCVADRDIAHEVQKVLTRRHWTADMNHLYPIFLPKHVEICFYRGNPSYQQCSVNSSQSAAFCAYHTFAHTAPSAVYATLPYPVYGSPTGYSCSTEFDAPGVQYPNAKPDADVTVSSLSHEMSEAITDPKLNTWTASDGNETADLCSDVYGALQGVAGRKWNQTINGDHYLTQEEFSNKEFAPRLGGCVQDENRPTVTSVSPAGGAPGRAVTVRGTGFRPGRTTVSFTGTPRVAVTATTTSKFTVTAPVGPLGVADVTVTTPNGTSALTSSDVYTDSDPTITDIASSPGPSSGTLRLTIDGTNFVPYTDAATVTFGGSPVEAVISALRNQLVVDVAAPAAAGSVPVTVTTPQNTASASFNYTG